MNKCLRWKKCELRKIMGKCNPKCPYEILRKDINKIFKECGE